MSEDADAEFFKGLAQQSQLNAFTDAGANPDEAASAITTARQMNLPPEVTALDPNGYAGVLKAQRNSEIVSSNPAIARYARTVPLATKVSNDDFENLDTLHKALLLSVQGQAEDLSGRRGGFGPLDPLVQGATGGAASESLGLVAALPGRRNFFKPLIEGLRGISDRAVQTDHSAVGTVEYNVGSMAGQLVTDFLSGGLVQGVAGLVGGPVGAGIGTATGMASAAALASHGRALDEQDQADAVNGTKTPELEKQLKAGVIGAATGALFSLGLHGPAADLIQTAVRDGISTALPRIALDTGATAALGAGINGILQEVHDLVMDAGKPGAEIAEDPKKRAELADKIRSAMVDGALYMGMAHAFGIGSNIIGDRLAIRAADQAAEQHKAAMDAADATETKTRSPEAFRQFAEIAARDKTVSIPADKIDELNMADTIRPLVSDFDEQINLGRASGGDVTIPYSAYLAGVDGSIDSQIAKDLRHTPEGLTQNEAEELRNQIAALPGMQQPINETVEIPSTPEASSRQVSDTNAKELYLNPLFPSNEDAGMTKPMFERYSRLIEQRHAAQNEAALEAARIEIRRRDSQAWKDTVGLVRDELAAKPASEWAAHDFITKGIFNGEKIPESINVESSYRFPIERVSHDEFNSLGKPSEKDILSVAGAHRPTGRILTTPSFDKLNEEKKAYALAHEEGHLLQKQLDDNGAWKNLGVVGRGELLAEARDASKIMRPESWTKKHLLGYLSRETELLADAYALWKNNHSKAQEIMPKLVAFFKENFGEPSVFVSKKIPTKLDRATVERLTSDPLPRGTTVKGGVDPEEMAQLLGYRSGHELVQALAGLEKGRGGETLGQYRKRLLDEATAKEMETRFGKFDDEIEREARATAMQHSVQEALHIEMQTLGDKIGAPPFKLDAMRDFVKEQFDRKSVKEARQLKAFSRMVGAEGRRAEMHLLAKNYQKAFQAKQKQLVAHLMASEAERFDREATKAIKRFDRLRRKPTIRLMDQGYLNQIHGLLNAFGMGVKRSPTELKETLAKIPLHEFVSEEADDGYDVMVSPLLYGAQPALNNATVETFRALDSAIKSMSKIGRDLKKIEIDGQKQELNEVKTAVIEQIRKTPLRYAKDPGRIMKSRDTVQQLTSHFMQFEGILADIDRNDPDGIMSKVFRPMVEGKNRFNDMTVEAGKRLPEYSIRAANEVVPNDIFINPKTERPYELSRGDAMITALYAGSKSGMDRLSKGYKLEPDQIRSWLNTTLRAEDWKWAQGMWDFFKWQWPQIEAKALRTTGVAPDRIDGVPTTNQHGTFTGGYVPIMYDPFSKHTLTIDRQNSENTYQSSTPSKSSMKSRVDGMSDQLQIKDTFARLAMEIKKDFHDLAMDEPLKDFKKIILDSDVRQEIQRRFGPGPDGEIVPFVKYVANQYNVANKEMAGAQRIMGGVRRNLSIAALTYNLGIMLSPNTGNLASTIVKLGARPADTVHWILHAPEAIKFIEENSNEIKHWDTNWNREAAETLTSLEGDSRWKAEVIRYGYHFAASIERHLGQIQWFAHYRDALQKGETHDNAAYLADKSLREDFHRADVLAMSQAMRQSEAWKLTTLFYGYGQLVFNRVHRIGNLAKTGAQKFSEDDLVGTRRDFGKAFALSMSHLVIPAALFGPLYIGQKKDSDSWLKYAGKLLLGQAGVAIPLGGRDIVAKALQGYDPHPSPIVGLGIGIYREAVDIARALGLSNKPVSKTWLKNAIQTTGAGFGVPFSGQASRTVPFVWHWWDGTDPPHTLGDIVRGMQTGTTKGPR